jgi:hypothetical protein
MEAGKRTLPIERSKVAVVALNTELVTPLRPRGSFLRLILRDGSRLSLASAEAGADRPLTGTTLFKAPVAVGVDDLVSLYIMEGPAVYISDMKPIRIEYKFFGTAAWPYVPDGSVAHRSLRVGDSTYDKGLGTHSETRLSYDLNRRYRRFEAVVGLDSQTGRRGSVRVKVLVDGKPQDVGGESLTARSAPLPVRVDVNGARELTLIVEFGAGGPVQDHVNWADARLIK